MNMIGGLGLLMMHMQEKHKDSTWWGDSGYTDASGNYVSLKCQICGEELVHPCTCASPSLPIGGTCCETCHGTVK